MDYYSIFFFFFLVSFSTIHQLLSWAGVISLGNRTKYCLTQFFISKKKTGHNMDREGNGGRGRWKKKKKIRIKAALGYSATLHVQMWIGKNRKEKKRSECSRPFFDYERGELHIGITGDSRSSTTSIVGFTLLLLNVQIVRLRRPAKFYPLCGRDQKS